MVRCGMFYLLTENVLSSLVVLTGWNGEDISNDLGASSVFETLFLIGQGVRWAKLFHPSTRYLWIGFDAEFFGRIGSVPRAEFSLRENFAQKHPNSLCLNPNVRTPESRDGAVWV